MNNLKLTELFCGKLALADRRHGVCRRGCEGGTVLHAVVTFVNRVCGKGVAKVSPRRWGRGRGRSVSARFPFFRLGFIPAHAAVHFASLSHLLSYFNARARMRRLENGQIYERTSGQINTLRGGGERGGRAAFGIRGIRE